MKNYEEYFSKILNELLENIVIKSNHSIAEFIVLPLIYSKSKPEEYQFKTDILKELEKRKTIDKASLNYYNYMLANIYESYSNLGRELTIKKIKDEDDKIGLNSVLPNQLELKRQYEEFEKLLKRTIISIYRNKINKENFSDSQILKQYILDLNEENFSNFEIMKIENFIIDGDYSKLNIIIEESRIGRKLN